MVALQQPSHKQIGPFSTARFLLKGGEEAGGGGGEEEGGETDRIFVWPSKDLKTILRTPRFLGWQDPSEREEGGLRVRGQKYVSPVSAKSVFSPKLRPK